jgi:twitching motility protein PilI
MARRSSLKEYQDEILRKMELARSTSDGVAEQVRFFGFQSAGRKFLVDASLVVELTSVSKLQPLPMAKPWAVGAANIKGSVYSVTDFGILFANVPTQTGKFIVLDDAIVSGAALLIEGLTGIYDRETIGVEATPDGASGLPDWVTGFYLFNNDRHHMVNLEKLIEDERFNKLQSGE